MKPYRIQRKGKRYWAMEIPAHYLPPGAGRAVIVATTREEAEVRWLKRVAEYRRGLDVNAAKKTLSEFLNEFLDQCRDGDQIERSTYEDYRHHIRTHIEPILGKVTLDRLTTREIDQFLVALKQKVSQRTKRRLAPKTIHYAYGVLRCALQLAVDYDYISFNPASAQSRKSRIRIKANTAPIRCFTPEQSQQFLKAVHQDRYACLYVLAVTTGLRKGELLGLQWADVDLDRSRLTVNHSLQFTRRLKGEDGPRYLLKGPKTKLSRRTIELPVVAVEALRRHRELQNEHRLLAGERWQELGFVFTSLKGTPLDTGNALHRFQTICVGAGLPKIRFYDLRHTHASLLIHEGVHPKKIAERLGHSSIKLTMDTYGHLFDGSDRESAERMDRLFGQKPGPDDPQGQAELEEKKGAKLFVMPSRKTG